MHPGVVTESDLIAYLDSMSNWGRWGPDDQLGTLNLITPEVRRQAAALVSEGVTVSCASDIDASGDGRLPSADDDGAAMRVMVKTGEKVSPEPRLAGAREFLGMVFHGWKITHLDGLSHAFWDGRMYNGEPAGNVTAAGGATRLGVEQLADGVVTRGVLLDVPRTRGVPWLEPGEGATSSDLDAAAAMQGIEIGSGDAVLLRTGYARMLRERPGHADADGRADMPGWHPECLTWLRERDVAVIGCDTGTEALPTQYPALRLPVHAVGIVAMGLCLLDNCDFEALAAACERYGRWEFLFMVAPLRVVGGTGSPVNPLATF